MLHRTRKREFTPAGRGRRPERSRHLSLTHGSGARYLADPLITVHTSYTTSAYDAYRGSSRVRGSRGHRSWLGDARAFVRQDCIHGNPGWYGKSAGSVEPPAGER